MNELTKNNVHEFPRPVQGGYRAHRSSGEKFPAEFIRAIRRALNRADRKGVPPQDGIARAWIAPDREGLPK